MHAMRLKRGLPALFLFVALAPVSAVGTAHATVIYDAVGDFSLASNPNGVWSYRSNGVLLSHASSTPMGSGEAQVWDNGFPYTPQSPFKAFVMRNTGTVQGLPSSPSVIVPNDHLDLDPQGTGSVEVRFTAPYSGTFHVRGDFTGVNQSSIPAHPVVVSVNGEPVYASVITQYGDGDHAVFDFVRTLGAGDTIDIAARTGASPHEQGTGVATQIEVAEPASLAVLGAGMLGIAALRRRRGE